MSTTIDRTRNHRGERLSGMIDPVVYVGEDGSSFQGSVPADVVRLVWYRLDSGEYRLCLHLRYPNGTEDFAPLQGALECGFLQRPK